MPFEEEDRPVRPCSDPSNQPLPRLFGETPVAAVEGAGGGVEGVGEAGDRDTVARPLHCGAHPPVRPHDETDSLLSGLLDPDRPGVRNARPASRQELADLILRYRDEQAARQARRRQEPESRPRFTAEQRLLILDAWLRSKLPAGEFAPLVGLSLHTLRAPRLLLVGEAAMALSPKQISTARSPTPAPCRASTRDGVNASWRSLSSSSWWSPASRGLPWMGPSGIMCFARWDAWPPGERSNSATL
jgi:hypothetical protein